MRESIGRYRLIERLGEGGMGVVYRARDVALGRDVALKMLHEGSQDPAARDRMRREARAAAGISHPHVCQVYEVAEEDDDLYLVMELLEGEALSDRIEREALGTDEALGICLEILSALDALHAKGYVHRDLKPSNVFLTNHGVKLLDFGLALPLEGVLGGDDARLTQTGMMVGTPGFMAPEQWCGDPVGPASDIFAVGALTFELLTGKPAFTGKGPMEIFHAIAHEQPPALVGSEDVEALDRVLQRALAKVPSDRYASAAEMAADLEMVRQHTGTAEALQARVIIRVMTLPFRVVGQDEETAFLAQGLPEAVAAALAPIESLVLKSGPAAGTDDPVAAAQAARVDLVLTGSILRAGERLRVTAQLVQVPDGEVRWSERMDAEVDDIFELQDELARHIVGSLAVPLAGSESRDTRDIRAATPEAYEYYLRANQVANNTGMLRAARDLYLECLERDPEFAPAWARLGRAYRVRAKYGHGNPDEEYGLAEEAFRKALALRPDLSIAHSLFTYFEIEQLGQAPQAMVRLVGQCAKRPSDPDLFAGLVVACRFCGLLDASVAADRRARRLDPGVRTSVAYTYWMRGEYEEAIRYDDEDMRYMVMDSLPMLGRSDEMLALVEELARTRTETFERNFVASKRAVLAGDRAACRAAVMEIFSSRFEDPEGLYHLTRDLAKVGEVDLALEKFGEIVRAGLHCPDTFARDPWLERLHGRPEFGEIVAEARAGHEAARRAFEDAGGPRLLGPAAGDLRVTYVPTVNHGRPPGA